MLSVNDNLPRLSLLWNLPQEHGESAHPEGSVCIGDGRRRPLGQDHAWLCHVRQAPAPWGQFGEGGKCSTQVSSSQTNDLCDFPVIIDIPASPCRHTIMESQSLLTSMSQTAQTRLWRTLLCQVSSKTYLHGAHTNHHTNSVPSLGLWNECRCIKDRMIGSHLR